MNQGFRVFHERLIDYAGLFPPAELNMATAVASYGRYRGEPEAWMLSRFICPLGRLDDLMGFRNLVEGRLGISAIAALGNDEDLAVSARAQGERIRAFHERWFPKAAIEAVEVKLPGFAAGSAAESTKAIQAVVREMAGEPVADIFMEIPRTSAWETEADRVCAAVRGLGETPVRLGFKIRCGGVAAAAFPSVDEVATAISACRRHEVAFKATAGLHHPMPRHDESIGARMHGFVPVFGAAVLAWSDRLDDSELRSVLAEEDPASFSFSDAGFSWKDHVVKAESLRSLRHRFVTSFGSCSFDEPREDLRSLSWLEGADRSRPDSSKEVAP